MNADADTKGKSASGKQRSFFQRSFAAGLVVFVLWTILDVLFRRVLAGTGNLNGSVVWPAAGTSTGWLLHGVRLVGAEAFTFLYNGFVNDKQLKTGLVFGALYGVGVGSGAAFVLVVTKQALVSTLLGWAAVLVCEAVLAGVWLAFLRLDSTQGENSLEETHTS